MGKIIWITSTNVGEVIRRLKAAPAVGFDTETTGLHPTKGKLRLIQLAIRGEDNETTCYILDAFKTDPRMLAPMFDGSTVLVGHNLVFELTFLWSVGIFLPHGKCLHDTMIAEQILDAGLGPFHRGYFSLAEVTERRRGIVMDKEGQTSDWSGTLEKWQLIYAAKDAVEVLPLYDQQVYDIGVADLNRTMLLEMRCLPGMAWLNISGMPVDKDKWKALAVKYTNSSHDLEYALADLTQTQDLFGWSTVNWRSGDQIKNFYAEQKQIILPDTTDYTLGELAKDGDDLASLIQTYREHGKRRDTYGISWCDQHIQNDGRIYPDWHQVEARSGRQSCSNPNLQNIPHSKEYRACFIPTPGWVFTIGDYGQIEFRIAVEITDDPFGMQALCFDNVDVHTKTALLILGSGDKEARQVAKSLNFGLLFGAGAETLRNYAQANYNVTLSLAEAVILRNKWRDIYTGIVAWHKHTGHDMRQNPVTVTRTLGGRRRLNVDTYMMRLNTPVQGTGADGIKAAIALCYETRHKAPNHIRPVGYIHDEIIFESPQDSAAEVQDWQERNMVKAMQSFLKKIPVEAEVKQAKSWADK